MKKLLLVAVLSMPVVHAHAAYFDTILTDPGHPKLSLTTLYTSKFAFDGAETSAAAVFHKADIKETIIPKRLLDAGVKPISWTLLEFGAGGNRQTGFVTAGAGINLGPTLLGPLTELLKDAGGVAATAGSLIVAPDGSGVKLSLAWRTDVIENGGVVRFNRMRFPPRYGVGYCYQF